MIELFEEGDSYAQLIDSSLLGVILHTVFVPPGKRGQGIGRRLLDRAIAYAGDRSILLAPVPDFDCPIDVEAWYARHGFEWTRSGVMMERQPQNQS